MKVTLKWVGASGSYEGDVHEHIGWLQPITEDMAPFKQVDEDQDVSGRVLFFNRGAVRAVLIEPDDAKETV